MAIDVGAQIRYWRDSSADDLDAARALLAAAKLRQAGFFVHLAVEKAIKACVVAAIRDVPPRSHDLLFLADKSAIAISQAQRVVVRFLGNPPRHRAHILSTFPQLSTGARVAWCDAVSR